MFDSTPETYFRCGQCAGPARMTARLEDDRGRRLPLAERRQTWSCPRGCGAVTLRFDLTTRKVVACG